MQTVNRLGLKVAIISTIAVVVIFVIISGIRVLLSQQEEPTPTSSSNPNTTSQLLDATDGDNDGIVDDLEIIYQTNPQLADTDEDGTPDGEEIALLRDPLNSNPDDGLESLTIEGTANTTTYTGRYLKLLPAGATRSEILSQERLTAFIEEERQPLLTEVPATSITTTAAEGKEAITQYLNSISSTHNTALKPISSEAIATAFQASYAQNQSTQLDTIIEQLTNNIRLLRDVSVPVEALALHQQLIAASEALLKNAQLLRNMKNDFVGGLVGAKNIEELGAVFNEIAQKVAALEAKYGIE